jgi:hypothetical protein
MHLLYNLGNWYAESTRSSNVHVHAWIWLHHVPAAARVSCGKHEWRISDRKHFEKRCLTLKLMQFLVRALHLQTWPLMIRPLTSVQLAVCYRIKQIRKHVLSLHLLSIMWLCLCSACATGMWTRNKTYALNHVICLVFESADTLKANVLMKHTNHFQLHLFAQATTLMPKSKHKRLTDLNLSKSYDSMIGN